MHYHFRWALARGSFSLSLSACDCCVDQPIRTTRRLKSQVILATYHTYQPNRILTVCTGEPVCVSLGQGTVSVCSCVPLQSVPHNGSELLNHSPFETHESAPVQGCIFTHLGNVWHRLDTARLYTIKTKTSERRAQSHRVTL